jgi:hypothetical protein
MSDDELYAEFLHGKRVVIVGPAPSMIGSGQGKNIDSYDVVVRIKKVLSSFENLKVDIGSRTDVVYSWLDRNVNGGGLVDFCAFEKDGVKFICCPYPDGLDFSHENIRCFVKSNGGRFKFHMINRDYYLSISEKIKSRPNSGIGAIMDLLKHGVSELYITGFTFFKGGYIKEYTDMNEEQALARMDEYKHHVQSVQMDLLKSTILEDKRVRVDGALSEILGL